MNWKKAMGIKGRETVLYTVKFQKMSKLTGVSSNSFKLPYSGLKRRRKKGLLNILRDV